MTAEFGPFHTLYDLAKIEIGGHFNPNWDGTYLGSRPSGEGSGFTAKVRLKAPDKLPDDVKCHAAQNACGFLYILTSTTYPILYVGAPDKDLRNGVFGEGRFKQHIEKLLAIRGGATHSVAWPCHLPLRSAS